MHSIGSPKFEPFVKTKQNKTNNILKKEKRKPIQSVLLELVSSLTIMTNVASKERWKADCKKTK